MPLEIEHFPVLALFSTCPSLKSGTPTPIKILFPKLKRIDLLPHGVESLQIKKCSLRKHLKLGNFYYIFTIIDNRALGG